MMGTNKFKRRKKTNKKKLSKKSIMVIICISVLLIVGIISKYIYDINTRAKSPLLKAVKVHVYALDEVSYYFVKYIVRDTRNIYIKKSTILDISKINTNKEEYAYSTKIVIVFFKPNSNLQFTQNQKNNITILDLGKSLYNNKNYNEYAYLSPKATARMLFDIANTLGHIDLSHIENFLNRYYQCEKILMDAHYKLGLTIARLNKEKNKKIVTLLPYYKQLEMDYPLKFKSLYNSREEFLEKKVIKIYPNEILLLSREEEKNINKNISGKVYIIPDIPYLVQKGVKSNDIAVQCVTENVELLAKIAENH
jgi:hypothetical protein